MGQARMEIGSGAGLLKMDRSLLCVKARPLKGCVSQSPSTHVIFVVSFILHSKAQDFLRHLQTSLSTLLSQHLRRK